jgi:hypothetical protein
VAEDNIFVDEYRGLILAVVVQLLQVHVCQAAEIETFPCGVRGEGAPAISRGKSPRKSREIRVSPRDDMTKNCDIMRSARCSSRAVETSGSRWYSPGTHVPEFGAAPRFSREAVLHS